MSSRRSGSARLIVAHRLGETMTTFQTSLLSCMLFGCVADDQVFANGETGESGLSDDSRGGDPCPDCVDVTDCQGGTIPTLSGDSWSCEVPGTGEQASPCNDGSECESGVCLPYPLFKNEECSSGSCCTSLCPCTASQVCTDIGCASVCREG